MLRRLKSRDATCYNVCRRTEKSLREYGASEMRLSLINPEFVSKAFTAKP